MRQRTVHVLPTVLAAAALALTACGDDSATAESWAAAHATTAAPATTEPIIPDSTETSTTSAPVVTSPGPGDTAPDDDPTDSGATTTATTAAPTAAPITAPPATPVGSASEDADLGVGAGGYELAGGDGTESDVSFGSDTDDGSAVLVTDGGSLTLTNVTIATTGNTSSSDNSSVYGQNAAVLAAGGSTIRMSGSTVTTSGGGANGVFATDPGSRIVIDTTTITTTGENSRGIVVSNGGAIDAADVTVSTAGANSAPIATDRGGGTITVTRGSFTSAGADSPGVSSAGTITIDGAKITANGAEAAVVEGSNTITATNATLSGAVNWGVMLHQSAGDRTPSAPGIFTQTRGSLAAATGPLFFVTNTGGEIRLSGVTLTAASGILLQASAGRWGTAGSNGGDATLVATGQVLGGDVLVDPISTVAIELDDGSTLTGAVNTAAIDAPVGITLDRTSAWTLTGDSYVTTLDGALIDGSAVTNITGNGFSVYYSTDDNPSLGGRTYQLAGGGSLLPR